MVRAREQMHAEWGRMTPKPTRAASDGIKSVALLHLMSQIGLGGARRLQQFIYGFGATGAFSQDGLSPPVDSFVKPAPPARPIEDAAALFDTRAQTSGWAHGEAIWREALSHVEKGWLDSPQP